MQGRRGGRAQASDVAGVGGDLGLHENHLHGRKKRLDAKARGRRGRFRHDRGRGAGRRVSLTPADARRAQTVASRVEAVAHGSPLCAVTQRSHSPSRRSSPSSFPRAVRSRAGWTRRPNACIASQRAFRARARAVPPSDVRDRAESQCDAGTTVPAGGDPQSVRVPTEQRRLANLMSELGMAIAPTAFHAARTTGLGGFALTLEASFTPHQRGRDRGGGPILAPGNAGSDRPELARVLDGEQQPRLAPARSIRSRRARASRTASRSPERSDT